jgi:hypothetical protein
MPKYEYTGAQELILPTLGIIINKGDVFEAPAGLTIPDVSLSSKAKKSADLYDAENEVEAAALDAAVAADEAPAEETK